MKWIFNNERTPTEEKFYYCKDTVGNKTMVHFHHGMWHSLTGHPVAYWLDELSDDESQYFYKEEYDHAVNEIGQLQEQLKEANEYIRELENFGNRP